MLLISLLIIASSSSHLSPVSSSAVTSVSLRLLILCFHADEILFYAFPFFCSSCRQQNSSFFKETSQLEQMMHMDEGDGMGRAVGGSAIQLRNITDLLDTLLLGYDQHLRPDMGGESLFPAFL